MRFPSVRLACSLFIAVLLASPVLAQQNSTISTGSISLECTLLKQNSFPQPGIIKMKYANTSSLELAFQFRLQLVATNGATQMDTKGGLNKLLPNKSGIYSFAAFTDQQAVNQPPVYPQSCLIDQIEICPANPPVGHVGYYHPFTSPKCVRESLHKLGVSVLIG